MITTINEFKEYIRTFPKTQAELNAEIFPEMPEDKGIPKVNIDVESVLDEQEARARKKEAIHKTMTQQFRY